MFGKIRDHAGDERKSIHQDIKGFSIVAKDVDKRILTGSAKQVKSVHIKKQMRKIRMNKSIRDKPVILVFLCNRGRVEDQVVHNFMRLKRKQRNDNRDNNNNKSNR